MDFGRYRNPPAPVLAVSCTSRFCAGARESGKKVDSRGVLVSMTVQPHHSGCSHRDATPALGVPGGFLPCRRWEKQKPPGSSWRLTSAAAALCGQGMSVIGVWAWTASAPNALLKGAVNGDLRCDELDLSTKEKVSAVDEPLRFNPRLQTALLRQSKVFVRIVSSYPVVRQRTPRICWITLAAPHF